jgi:TonB family protein
LDQETTYKWIQERLRELNSGTLSESDRLRLVSIAKDDPFVADALEGFHANPEVDHNDSLDKLTRQIKFTRRERRRWFMPNLTVTAIAASFLVILATYGVIVQVQKKNEEAVFVFVAPDTLSTSDTILNDIVMESEPVEETKRILKDTPSESTSRKETSQSSPVTSSVAKTTEAVPTPPAVESDENVVTGGATYGNAQPGAAVPSPSSMDDSKSLAADRAMKSQSEMAGKKRDEGYYANQMDPDVMRSRVTGRVIEAVSGDPLMYAKLSVSYTNQLFYTDAQGYFELYLPEEEAVVNVTYTKLVDSTFIIKQGDENIEVALNEGTTIGTMQNQEAVSKGPVTSLTNPAIESYFYIHRYITSNATLELTPDPSSARRKVIVEFKVKKDGRPSDMTVIESSRDKTYDGEALRLIKESPDWVCPGEQYPCMRRYTFYFR